VRTALREARRTRLRRAAERRRHHQRRDAERVAPSAAAEVDQRFSSALALLDGLPARQRAALTLRYVHDLTDEEIGAALGCRDAAVRKLLSRGRAALRGALEARTRSHDAHDH
jgi:RNA polymerase sigma factor (sigma-70 family)